MKKNKSTFFLEAELEDPEKGRHTKGCQSVQCYPRDMLWSWTLWLDIPLICRESETASNRSHFSLSLTTEKKVKTFPKLRRPRQREELLSSGTLQARGSPFPARSFACFIASSRSYSDSLGKQETMLGHIVQRAWLPSVKPDTCKSSFICSPDDELGQVSTSLSWQ